MHFPFCRNIFLLILTFIGFVPPSTAQNIPNWTQPLKLCRQISTNEPAVFSPVSDDTETFFLSFSDGNFTAFDINSGQIKWRSFFGGDFLAQPLYSDKKLYILNGFKNEKSFDAALRIVNSETGLTVKQISFADEKFSDAFILIAENYLILTTDTGLITFLDKNLGTVIWKKYFPKNISFKPVYSSGMIFFVEDGKTVWVHSAKDGMILHQIRFTESNIGNLFYKNGLLRFGDGKGFVYSFDLKGEKIESKTRIGASLLSINDFGEILFITSNDGFAYGISNDSGDKKWKIRFSGRPDGSPVIKNNFAVIKTVDGNLASIIDLTKGKIINQFTFAEENYNVGEAISVGENILIPTNKSLQIFSPACKK